MDAYELPKLIPTTVEMEGTSMGASAVPFGSAAMSFGFWVGGRKEGHGRTYRSFGDGELGATQEAGLPALNQTTLPLRLLQFVCAR